ncbi:copia protein [Tanacetum coccineum]
MVSTTRCLELLHMDLFGPSAIRSYGGNRYTLVIVDDYSWFTWTRFLQNKNKAFEQFEIFSKNVQNQLGCSIVSIRTDHGREFDNEVQFRDYCDSNGITHNFSALRTPQSNGVVERKNLTLQEMSRTIPILGKTPYEILRGGKPTLDYFKVFGSKFFVLNTKDCLTKFDLKSYEVEEEAIKVSEKKPLGNDVKDETLAIDEIVNIKESKSQPKYVDEALNDESWVVAIEFLNGFINEEVYVAQPSGFNDFEKPNHVHKLKKALYGLKQALKAWYDRLKAFLIKHEYNMGMIDNTLFTKKKGSNLITVQIYVDDIIFGLTCQELCDDFAKIMHDEFEMSMMGELNFFLGLQIKQLEGGIFFNQYKYIKEMLKTSGLEDFKPMKTPMSSDMKLTKDGEGESVDNTKYRGMIDNLLYLTISRLYIKFSVCLCARFQEDPKTSHLEAVKRIF